MAGSASKRLSLCMIVRNEEMLLPGCLESVRGVVDQIVAVDTGSSDATPEIVRAHQGTLLRHAWEDDFSAARNVSLDAATGDWILWMDADERLRPEEHVRLRRLIESDCSEDAFLVPIRSETPTGAQVTRGHRLFRNGMGIRFSGQIHEQVSPSFARSRVRAARSAADFTIDHLGYNFSADKLRSKHERNLKLLNVAKQQDPRDAYVRFCLGQALLLLGDAPGAEKEIRAALGEVRSEPVSRPLPVDIRAAAFNNLAQCALDRCALEEALRQCSESLRFCPKQVTAHLMAYRAHQKLRHTSRALQELIAADRLLDQPTAGDSAIEVTVDRAELWCAMGQGQLQLGQFAQARQSLQRALVARNGRCRRTLAALAQCAIAENALDEALRLANAASALAPEDDGLADMACFILLKLNRFDDAAERMSGLIERRPNDQVLRRRLAGVLVKAGRPQEALAALRVANGCAPVPESAGPERAPSAAKEKVGIY